MKSSGRKPQRFESSALRMIDEQEMQALVVRYLSGEDVRDIIIEKHLPLVKAIANRYARIRPKVKEDLNAQAMLGLTQAVVWAKTKLTDTQITYYIICTVKSFLRDFLARDRIIKVPAKEARRRLRDHVELPNVKGASKNVSDGESFDDYERAHQDDPVAEYKELIRKLRLTPAEKKVLDFRLDGYTFKEIASRLKRSEAWVARTVAEIQRKYLGRK